MKDYKAIFNIPTQDPETEEWTHVVGAFEFFGYREGSLHYVQCNVVPYGPSTNPVAYFEGDHGENWEQAIWLCLQPFRSFQALEGEK